MSDNSGKINYTKLVIYVRNYLEKIVSHVH